MPSSFQPNYISYSQTRFSKIIIDYVNASDSLRNFYEHEVNLKGIKMAITARENYSTNRKLLVESLQEQYKNVSDCDLVKANIERLLQQNTFTICTAHQPNIFTGHLYFIYKILHTIKLADNLKKQLPENNFIPVYFMGSEDADIEELNHVIIDNKKYTWNTAQKGAVGRMKVDEDVIKLIDEIEGRLSVEKYGNNIITLLKKCFQKNTTIEQATFLFVHEMFKDHGLIIFLPDSRSLKSLMNNVFEQDIFENIPSEIVSKTSLELAKHYKVQAHPREINLFYLKNDIRNRIVQVKDKFLVNDTNIVFTKDELQSELKNYPERFSPNVILRGLYQEMILPNIAFIGGGGELAYWLELKDLFHHYQVPFPALILRNSFLIIENKINVLRKKHHISIENLFDNEENVFNNIIKKESHLQLSITGESSEIEQTYTTIKNVAAVVDATLEEHVKALQIQALKKLSALEKKILKAEKRKFKDTQTQVSKIYQTLFPDNNLQERSENFMLFYSKWGKEFFNMLYKNSLCLEQEFCVIEEIVE